MMQYLESLNPSAKVYEEGTVEVDGANPTCKGEMAVVIQRRQVNKQRSSQRLMESGVSAFGNGRFGGCQRHSKLRGIFDRSQVSSLG